MKFTKRIFIALLILAISVSSFAVVASAEENGVVDYAKLLEYYEEQCLVDYDFSETVDYSADFLTNSARSAQYVCGFVADENAPAGKYLSVAIKERPGRGGAYSDIHSYFAWTSSEAIDDFNVDMTVSGAKYNSDAAVTDENLPKIIIVVGDTQFTNISNALSQGVTIASIDYKTGNFTYLKAVEKDGATTGELTNASYKINEGAWYDVSLTYDVDNGVSITVTNCADATDTVTVTDGYVPYANVRDIRIGAHGTDNGVSRGTEVKYGSVRLLGGVYHRDVANMQADLEANVLEMYELFLSNEAGIDAKISACEVAKQLIAYGFTSANADVIKALEELSIGAVGLYNSRIETFVSTIDTLATFAQKRAYADEVLTYVEALNSLDLSDATAEMVAKTAKNIADFEAINASLISIANDSVAFIALAETLVNDDLNNYAVVAADLALLNAYNIDSTYEGIADAYAFYISLVNAESSIRTGAELFINAVNLAGDETLDFNARVAAFRTIEGLYMDNETYPGITETIDTYLNVLAPYMTLEISNAENFIIYVKKADYASYLSAKQENLAIAKGYMDVCQPTFTGVAEAKVLYAEVEAFVAEQLANAEAYINAVNALDSLTGAALTNGIKNAQSLKEAGNVVGVDGITEANVKLDQIIASIELVERYCIHFVNLVASLDKASSIEAKFELLSDAKAAEADADKSYAGVTDASSKLAQAIADFNAQVNAINAEFDKANDVAANSCNVGGNATAVSSQVVALVKKFFDEE